MTSQGDAEETGQQLWGAETDDPHIDLAGAGARRGGGVSGIAGHNAAMALPGRHSPGDFMLTLEVEHLVRSAAGTAGTEGAPCLVLIAGRDEK